MNNTSKYMSAVFGISVIVVAIASYFFLKSDNAVGPNLITAFVGVVMSAMVTLVLLNGQTKEEEKKERNLKLYNAKLQVFSDFVYDMYECLRDNKVTEEMFSSLRTKLLGKVCFFVNDKEVLNEIEKELDNIKDLDDNDNFARAFAGITGLLQKDLSRNNNNEEVLALWGKFEEISANTSNEVHTNVAAPNNYVQEETTETSEILEQQAWHFIMWNDVQVEKLKIGFKELSLIEYDEDWRTNLVKQIAENDIIMLFRRGGYGYVGAFKAIGWRVFYFEEEREEIQMFGQKKQVIIGEQYFSDIKAYDIYESGEDGATICANIIVEPIAFVPEGVGNPGGVYRRTISRYDSHYAWQLMERFRVAQPHQ